MANRQTAVKVAREAYEDALIRGLCPAGAFEVAAGSIPPVEPPLTIDELNDAMTRAAADMPTIRIKRAYDPPAARDGVRVLVDRLWPRGLAKDAAKIDEWFKDLAPSDALRKWFGHDPARWAEFERRYRRELVKRKESVAALSNLAAKRRVTLLYAANDESHNNAVALLNFLNRRSGGKRKSKGG